MLHVPTESHQATVAFAQELIEQCRVSSGMRSAYYRMLNIITETGRYNGTKSLINLLYRHLDRTAAHLFSPVELKFSVDFDNVQPKFVLDRAAVAGKMLTRQWERSNTDIAFGRGVFEALKYGVSILKQWVQVEGPHETPAYYKKLVMPWQFGVYREDENDIDRQPAVCETSLLTMPEVWQRIYHMPDARKLYNRIKAHAKRGGSSDEPTSFFHQILSTSQLDTTGAQGLPSSPGGIVALGTDPNYSIMGPSLAVDTAEMHEIWVQDEDDYTTIQLIEPDILIAPRFKKANLLIKDSKLQPYRVIQPNESTNWFWGRSELLDLIEPQALLATWCDDSKRLVGLQIDKLLGFIGETGLTDELYGQFRSAGYTNLPQGAQVTDLTPKFPSELMPMIKFVIEIINTLGGFPNIMQGQGEPGVRAGVHASTLLKTGSPTLRDRALLVERQCAMAADLTMSIREAKDASFYWTKADEPIKDVEETKFILADLPDDWRVTVDSHSSSPIFSDENQQLIMAGLKLGFLDGDYALDNMPYPNKEAAKAKLHEKEKKQAEFMQKMQTEHPEMIPALLKKQGGRR